MVQTRQVCEAAQLNPGGLGSMGAGRLQGALPRLPHIEAARLLHHDVDVLLLDEPTRGIDVGAKARIYALIDELAMQGRAILLVSSHVPELLGVCDRVAVMCRGRLGPARPVDEIDEHSLMQEAIGHG